MEDVIKNYTKKIMKKTILTIALLLGSFIGINAQTEDNTEFYAGYQFLRTNVEVRTPSFAFNRQTDSHGVNLSATEYVSKPVGFTAEIGANFDGNGRNVYTVLGGLTLKANRDGKIQPFAKGLAGMYVAQNQGFNSNQTKRDFAYSVGFGLDVKFKNFGWRVVQADYLATRNFGQFDNNVRVGTGFVF